MPTASRFRLPLGLTRLRLDFGARLRRYRRGEGLTQVDLASMTNLSRETISRIEKGRVQPRPDTIDEIMRVLSLDMGKLAVKGRATVGGRPARYFDGSSRGEYRHHIGRMIRAGRELEKRSLRKVSEQAGLSAAQISRIERGEGDRSAAYMDDPADARLPKAKRRVILMNPELRRLADLGFRAKKIVDVGEDDDI